MEPVPEDIGIPDAALTLGETYIMLDKVPSKTSSTNPSSGKRRKNSNNNNVPVPRVKPPDAPKRFRSSFIFFSMEKHKEIKDKMKADDDGPKVSNITKAVADAWQNLDATEREHYEEMARRDKERYDIEKSNYVPPPGYSLTAKRTREPGAPKRPMSAYLNFANQRRGEVKAQNPDCSNGEISKILSDMWKDLPPEVRKKYKDEESALWAAYKSGMQEWRKRHDGRKRANFKEVPVLAGDHENDAESPRKKRQKNSAGDFTDVGHETGFDDHQLGLGMDPSGNPNPEEMMAASALRGVRGGPQQQTGMGVDPNQYPQSPGGYGAFLGMTGMNSNANGMNGMNPMFGGTPGNVPPPPAAAASGHPGSFGQMEMSNFPYNQYGNYQMSGHPQAMIMAQLRGNSNSYQQQFPGFLCKWINETPFFSFDHSAVMFAKTFAFLQHKTSSLISLN
mmetsp:Transcript_831/g.1308  ORF Transcript_831/g.1308 Transcript_831/m.1308 type:complete len:449 (+) Transcript_831:90-1436(+)